MKERKSDRQAIIEWCDRLGEAVHRSRADGGMTTSRVMADIYREMIDQLDGPPEE